ncbi:MAG: Uma2 family endonuclease [Acidobacteria bacterium]|nr:Uma2 family endonuclease [Acidobacteriota bacterium]
MTQVTSPTTPAARSTSAAATSTTTSQAELNALVCDSLPPQGCWGDEHYLWLTDRTNRLAEFTDGYVELLPLPTVAHQAILQLLIRLLDAHLAPRGGFVLFAGLRVRIREGNFREPDLAALRRRSDPRNEPRYWQGADFVAEVVSSDDPARDLVDKPRDYAEAGIPEYWIVDPRVETITVLTLSGGAYAEHGVFARGDTATSPLLDGFAVDVTALFDYGQG